MKVIQLENVSKMYRLGEVGTGTISHDLARAWAKFRGKEDPFAKIGQVNNREESGGEYVWALKDINLEVEEGEILGIIGRNGAGKSTLLKLLSRVTAPTTGRIRARGRIASLLEVGTGFHPELTGRENVYLNGALLGMTRREITRRMEEIVEFSGCAKYIDTPVKRYSSGMTVRLGFAVAAHLECEILIVDEVLAVGDAEFQKKCMGKMKEVGANGKTVLFVSHNISAIRQLCTAGALFDSGKSIAAGRIKEVVDRYQVYYSQQLRAADFNLRRPQWAIPRIQNVRLVDDHGNRIREISMGSSIRIDVEYSAPDDSPIVKPVLGVVLKNQLGDIIAAVNTRMTGSHFAPSIDTTAIIQCKLCSPPLLCGQYSVDIWLGDGSHDIDLTEECVIFNIVPGNIYKTGVEPFAKMGTIYLCPQWTHHFKTAEAMGN